MISILQTASDEVVTLLSDQKPNGLTTPEHG
jgi:hypothetical protein